LACHGFSFVDGESWFSFIARSHISLLLISEQNNVDAYLFANLDETEGLIQTRSRSWVFREDGEPAQEATKFTSPNPVSSG
jgi:hypothetical protein